MRICTSLTSLVVVPLVTHALHPQPPLTGGIGHTVSPPLSNTSPSRSSSTISSSTLHALRSSTRANSSFPGCICRCRCSRSRARGNGEGDVGRSTTCEAGSPGQALRTPAKRSSVICRPVKSQPANWAGAQKGDSLVSFSREAGGEQEASGEALSLVFRFVHCARSSRSSVCREDATGGSERHERRRLEARV